MSEKELMNADEDPYEDVEVIMLDEEGVREAVDNALARAGCTWEELQAQAREGRFTSPVAHDVWFVVSTFLEPSDPGPPDAEAVEVEPDRCRTP